MILVFHNYIDCTTQTGIYKENASKNRQGGIAQMRLEHKSVTIVANPVVGERCHVFLLDTYISKMPPAAVEKDIFYCKPLSNVPTDPKQIHGIYLF